MEFKEIFSKYKNIAVYGMSTNPEKPANEVPAYIQSHGYNIIPINPGAEEINGAKAFKKIADIPQRIDILNVFRPSEEAVKIVEQAIERKKERGDIDVIWLQLGIYNQAAKNLAESYEIEFIQDRCIKIEHMRHG